MVKVPGDALSGLAGLRLPSSSMVWETHHENAPFRGNPQLAFVVQFYLEKHRQLQCARSRPRTH